MLDLIAIFFKFLLKDWEKLKNSLEELNQLLAKEKGANLELQLQLNAEKVKTGELISSLEQSENRARKLEKDAEERAMTSSVLNKALAEYQLKCGELDEEAAKLKEEAKVILKEFNILIF